MRDNEYPDAGLGGKPGRSWFRSALALYRESAEFPEPSARDDAAPFLERAQAAAETVVSIGRLRSEQQRRGFTPMPIERYWTWLAGVAAVDLAPVLAWAGIAGGEFSEDESWVAGAARLGRALGIDFRRLMLHFRISLVEQRQGLRVTLMLANRGAVQPGHSLIDECEELIRDIEQQDGPDALRRVHHLEHVVRSVFEL